MATRIGIRELLVHLEGALHVGKRLGEIAVRPRLAVSDIVAIGPQEDGQIALPVDIRGVEACQLRHLADTLAQVRQAPRIIPHPALESAYLVTRQRLPVARPGALLIGRGALFEYLPCGAEVLQRLFGEGVVFP